TDDNGTFTIHLNRGAHDIGVWKRGYATQDAGGIEVSESMAPLKLKLEQGAQISGRVVRKGGKPVDEGIVYAMDASQQQTAQAAVASDGTFTIDSLKPGTFMVQFGRRGGMREPKAVTAPASNVVLELSETVALQG